MNITAIPFYQTLHELINRTNPQHTDMLMSTPSTQLNGFRRQCVKPGFILMLFIQLSHIAILFFFDTLTTKQCCPKQNGTNIFI